MNNPSGGDGTLDVFGIKLLNNRAVMPTRGTADAAGCDLYSVEDVIIQPGSRTLVGTGLAMQFPKTLKLPIAPAWTMSIAAWDSIRRCRAGS